MFTATLLGRHVSRRAHHRADRRQTLIRHCDRFDQCRRLFPNLIQLHIYRRRSTANFISITKLDQAEVEHLDGVTTTTIRLEPDIIRLEISMNDAGAMGLFDSRANLFEDVDHPRDRQRTFFSNDLSERAAIEILHDEISDWTIPRLCDAEVSNVDDVRVSQPAGGLC